jgi:uncharacterized protein
MCELDDHGYCRGCLRTLEEVAGWLAYSDTERDSIISELDRRSAGPPSTDRSQR